MRYAPMDAYKHHETLHALGALHNRVRSNIELIRTTGVIALMESIVIIEKRWTHKLI